MVQIDCVRISIDSKEIDRVRIDIDSKEIDNARIDIDSKDLQAMVNLSVNIPWENISVNIPWENISVNIPWENFFKLTLLARASNLLFKNVLIKVL